MFSVRTPSYKLNANMSLIVLKIPVCICVWGVGGLEGVLDLLRHLASIKKTFALLSRAHMG